MGWRSLSLGGWSSVGLRVRGSWDSTLAAVESLVLQLGCKFRGLEVSGLEVEGGGSAEPGVSGDQEGLGLMTFFEIRRGELLTICSSQLGLRVFGSTCSVEGLFLWLKA